MVGRKPYIFVVMPFDKSFDDIYRFGIKQAVDMVGGYCERTDEMNFLEPIYDRIINSIEKADIIIADLSGKNANVFYEVGYAHCLRKRVIHLVHSADEIPFDLKGFPHVVYAGSVSTLQDSLASKLRWAIEETAKNTPVTKAHASVFLNRVECTKGKSFKLLTEKLQESMTWNEDWNLYKSVVPYILVEVVADTDERVPLGSGFIYTQGTYVTNSKYEIFNDLLGEHSEHELACEHQNFLRKFQIKRDFTVAGYEHDVVKCYLLENQNVDEENKTVSTALNANQNALVRIMSNAGIYDIEFEVGDSGICTIVNITNDHIYLG